MTTPIPQPPAIPFLGNIKTIEREVPLRSFELLAEKYGEIYQLNMLGLQQNTIQRSSMLLISGIFQATK